MQQFLSEVSANAQNVNAWLAARPLLGALVIAWLFAWKGLALWKAARRNDRIWFLVLFLVNLFSVLEILYFFIFSERERVKGQEVPRA